jgi:hypothetical protein
MFREKFLTILVIWVFVLVTLVVTGCKKHEHPTEHPSEHPEGEQKQAAITKDELADAVEAYVRKESASHGGYFIAFDEKAGKELKLTLDKVHRKRLSKVGDGRYFACADFKTPEGKIYDLDVFMTGSDKDYLAFSKFMVHKEAGKERYTWYEERGIWKTKQVGTTIEEHPKEHPQEHPK